MPCVNHADVATGLNPCVRCGKTFCGDCLVELKGGRFCALCKAEEVKDRQSGVTPGELDLASIGQRFGAQFVDGLVFMVIWVPLFMGLGVFAASTGAAGSMDETALGATMLVLMLVIFGVVLCYEGFFLMWRGQTLGKMALKIKVVTPEGEPLRAWQCWVRPLVRVLFSVLQYLTLVDYLPALFTKQKTAIHDMAAKTRVVRLSR